MQINMPVTDREVVLEEGQEVVTRTDLQGVITYANQDFIEISGFTEEELIGQNHHIVRHPDMPPAAFEDLWATIKAGRPWVNIVKNRCKSGDYYWVKANVTPIETNGKITGYLSVRRKPTQQEISTAAQLYRDINDGKAKMNQTSFLSRITPFRWMCLWQKLLMSLSALLIPLAVLLFLLVNALDTDIEFSQKEIYGTEYMLPVSSLQQHVAQHRGTLNAYLNGDKTFGGRLEGMRALINEDITAIDAMDNSYSEFLSVSPQWEALKGLWRTLEGDLSRLNAGESFARHTALIEEIIGFIQILADQSNLTLDPQLDSSYLMDLISFKLPPLVEQLGLLRGLGSGLAAQQSLTPEQRDSLLVRHHQASSALNSAHASFKVAFSANATLEAKLASQVNSFVSSASTFLNVTEQELLKSTSIKIKADDFFKQGSGVIAQTSSIYDEAGAELMALLQTRTGGLQVDKYWSMGGVAAMLILALALFYRISTGILRPLRRAIMTFGRVTEQNFRNDLQTDQEDEIGDVLRALNSMQIKLGYDLTESRAQAAAALRIQVALDNVSSNVMVADSNGQIIYLNDAVLTMLRNAQEAITKDLPNFNVDNLLGANFDSFHKNPAHQRNLLQGLTSTHNVRIKIGGRNFDLTANPVVNSDGRRMGTVVEWLDVTEQLDAEKQVERLIERAVAGDLNERLDVSVYQGFMKRIAEGFNQMLDTVVVPIKEVRRVLSCLAEGDLTKSMQGEFQGEYAHLNDALDTTLNQLRRTVGGIHGAGNQIQVGSTEIAQGNATLSQRTEEQAASLEETASSMEEMTSTVKQNADNARQANQLAIGTREQAEKGGQVATDAVGAMETITKSSKKISEIIGVIDEIAFQTNLLALNAAVEAARAGEQGRGFAVVASEVRNLAQRSASAAKDIKELINDSVDKVEEGTRLVGQSGNALEEIVHSVKKVSDIVAEIAAASAEQATGIEQVNKAISQMDEVTQQNAALVEQTATASNSMSEQAVQMMDLVTFFKVADNQEGAVTREQIVQTAKPSPALLQGLPTSKKKPSSTSEKQRIDDNEWAEF